MRLEKVQNAFFILLLIFVTLAFWVVVRDLAQPLFWAAVLAVLFQPAHRFWKTRVGVQKPWLPALLTILTVIAILIIPLLLVGMAVSTEIVSLYNRIQSGEINLQGAVSYIEQSVPALRSLASRAGVDLEGLQARAAGAAVAVSQYLAQQALAFGQNAIRFTALLFVMLYVLFFFVRDGEQLTNIMIRAIPLGHNRERRLFSKFVQVTRATMKGTLVVGLVQGTIGGLLFWILGIGAPVLWGVIMTLLSLLPAVGSALIWAPAAIYLIATGSVVKGIILLVAGTLIIGLADNVLRPMLVGRDTRMPDYLILIATLGGLTAFGISGFVIGPILAALFLAVWDMFQEDYGAREDTEGIKSAVRDPHGAAGDPPPGSKIPPDETI